MMPTPEVIADYACHTGENPLWHPVEKRLYWCDIPAGRIFRYDPSTQEHLQIYAGRPVGGFTFQASGGLLLFMDRGAIAAFRDDILTVYLDEIPAERTSRFNDVIADPVGRVFCGTMSSDEHKGSLYRLDLDGSLHHILEGIGCSNGMAFTQDHRGFFYTDSFAHEIYLFDYNKAEGSLSNQRVFVRFDETQGLPDGATLDAEGYLWSALWDGGCVVRISPDAEIVERWSLPAPKTSSLAFGGDNLSEIYVTSAGGHEKEHDGTAAGALFRLSSVHQGLPEFLSRIATRSITMEMLTRSS